jgi:hypothetical protein
VLGSTNGGTIRGPTPWIVISREDVARFKPDAAAVDAVMNGQEKVKVSFAKANEAVMEAKELMQKAGIPPELSDAQDESSSAEGSEEDDKKNPHVGSVAGFPLLPKMPCRSEHGVKAVAKQNLAKITELLQKANVTVEAPENLVMLWDDLCRLVDGAGLSEAETKAAVLGVTGQITVALCIGRNLDLEKWRQTLSERYLNPTKAGGLLRRLYTSRRSENENSVTYLTRVGPLVRAVMLMNMLPPATALGAIWDSEALGKDYCQQNATLYEQILVGIERGQFQDVDELAQGVQVRTKLEVVPKIATPVVPTPKPKRCSHCRREGHSERKCWKKHPEMRPEWARNDSNNKSNEAPASECVAVPRAAGETRAPSEQMKQSFIRFLGASQQGAPCLSTLRPHSFFWIYFRLNDQEVHVVVSRQIPVANDEA